MKKSKRETLIKAFEIVLIGFNVVDTFALATKGKLDTTSIKIRLLYELCLDELREDKPDEKLIRSYMSKMNPLREDKLQFPKSGITENDREKTKPEVCQKESDNYMKRMKRVDWLFNTIEEFDLKVGDHFIHEEMNWTCLEIDYDKLDVYYWYTNQDGSTRYDNQESLYDILNQ